MQQIQKPDRYLTDEEERMLRSIEAGENGPAFSPLAVQIEKVVLKLEAVDAILEEMLATLRLPANQPHLPESLQEMVKHWHDRYTSIQ